MVRFDHVVKGVVPVHEGGYQGFVGEREVLGGRMRGDFQGDCGVVEEGEGFEGPWWWWWVVGRLVGGC